MTNSTPFSCFFIGEGTLLIQCAEILTARGHAIYGFISPDPAVQRWADERNIPHRHPRNDWLGFIGQQPFDYLFSIANHAILPAEIVTLPRKAAINYHDAPLPKYAGTFATFWALIHRESTHGITWHEMSGQVDAGNILKQRMVEIAPHDTTVTLSAKCYEMAISAFAELVEDLATDRMLPIRQNLAERSFFPRSKRPAMGAVISWQEPAEVISALARALDFGPYPNPKGLPKLALGSEFLIIAELDVLSACSTAAPGTITRIDAELLQVATTTTDIALRKLRTIDGQDLRLAEVVATFGLRQGDQLPALAPELAERLTTLHAATGRHEEFWIERLAALQPIVLPFMERQLPGVAIETAQMAMPIPESVCSYLASSQQNFRSFLRTAFVAYLAQISNMHQFDLGFSSAALRRDLGELDRFFASMPPLRVEVMPGGSYKDLAQALDAQLAVVEQHKTYDRDITLRYPGLGALPEQQRGWTLPVGVVEVVDLDHALPPADLILAIAESDATCVWVYNPAVLDSEMVERMQRQFAILLQSLASDPAQPIADLPLLGEAERRQILHDWNATAVAYPQGCLHDMIAAQVARTPDAPAVVFAHTALSYAKLNARANQVAHHLQTLGVGPNVAVGVYMERSLDLVIGLLSVLKAGGAYVPLDPTYPSDRIAFMLDDVRPVVLLTQQHLVDSLPAHAAAVLCLDADWAQIEQQSSTDPEQLSSDEQLAYIIYTSGSTGQPKGTLNTHRGIVNRLLWMQDAFGLDASDRVLQKTPFSFDVSVWEFFWPLLTGATLVVAKPGGHQNPGYLVDLIRQEQITTLHFVPSMLQIFLEEPNVAACTSLRRVICSGEALGNALQQQFFARMAVELHNLYGPTEAAVDVTWWPCQRDSHLTTVPIGKPIANTQMYILDRRMQPVPVGVPGELYIGGVQVGRGYHRRPALTAEKFVPDPFTGLQGNPPGARLYRTGDLARYQADGQIEFLGRIDHQVKLRGIRIELDEIEAVLLQHHAVEQAVVMVQTDQSLGQRLIGYVVKRQAANDAEALRVDLHSFLQDRLPAYMVPPTILLLDEIPLTPNGKIDRKALAKLDVVEASHRTAFVAPRTPLEEALVELWNNVLGTKSVGVHDNFFELGGHSLLATQLVSRVRDALQADLLLPQVFAAPTVAQMAELIKTIRAGDYAQAGPPLRRIDHSGPLPLSFAQERMWFLNQLEPGSPFYNMPSLLRITGRLDTGAFERSLNTIISRHEILRATFMLPEGRPMQVIAPPTPIDIPVVDLRGLPADEREAAAQEIVNAESQTPFDLAHGPLVRVRLFQLDDTESLVLFTTHHIIFDGWSIDVLAGELGQLYSAFARGDEPSLPELPIQYADFAVWEREWLQGEELERQLHYWKHQLGSESNRGAVPLLDLPTDRPRPPVESHSGKTIEFTLPQPLAAALGTLCQRAQVTPFMTLLAAFQVLLFRYSGQDDIAVGTPISNRNRREIEPLIGCFINTLVLRADLSGQPSFWQLLDRVRLTTLGAYEHQDLPFEVLVDTLQPTRQLSYNPLFQVMFVMQNTPVQELDLPHARISIVELRTETAKTDLVLEIAPVGETLTGNLTYNTDLFDHDTMARMLAHFVALLEGIVADPEQPIDRLPLLTAAEQHHLLVDWNATAAPFPRDVCLHQLVEAQAAQHPDAIAITYAEHALTYRQLDRRANQLAHQLQALGVGPDVRVGLLLTRSLDVVLGALGVLKAGGAYLPLDPAYPPERLQFMLGDAQAPILLTQHDLPQIVPSHALRAICLDTDWPTIAQQPDTPPMSRATAEHLAYVIYTSGSTGLPKGVGVPHRGALNLVTWHQRTYDLTPRDRATLLAGLAFDASVWEIWPYLCSGASLHLPSEAIRSLPSALVDWLIAQDITLCFLPTPLAEAVIAEPQAAQLRLRGLLTGGDVLHAQAWSRLPFPVINHYGPTENTVVTTWGAVGDSRTALPTIGRPIANTQVYVLDAQGQPVPVGVAGELYIGGASLARGYLNRPALTAEKFVPNAFGCLQGDAGTRLYRTGDLVRYLPDGTIDFLGRIDHQVKVRGFRIELGEIEAVLLRHTAVEQAVVMVHTDQAGGQRLIGYIVKRQAADNAEALRAELQLFLQTQLPAYMVPATILLLDGMPLTPNGKIDRKALAKLDVVEASRRTAFVAPRTPLEDVLLSIWQEVCHLSHISVDDNFFELGGNSLGATQIVSRLQKAFKIHLTVRDIFAAPTIATLARHLLVHEQQPGYVDKVAVALKRVWGMSPEERQRMLQQKQAKKGV